MTTLIYYNACMVRQVANRLAVGASILALASVSLFQIGCGSKEPEVKSALQVVEDVSGWYDAGIVNGQNKLVPEVAFRAKNVANGTVSNIDFNVVFHVISDPQELGAAYLRGIDVKGLPPGQTSAQFVARSRLGYTSQEPRAQMLQHSQFKDVEAEIFAKRGSESFVSLGKLTIKRQLLTQQQ
jgi:hypothetical protein